MTVVRHGYPQLWVRQPPPSDDDHPPNSDYEDESSELSELDSDNPSEEESTPDTEGYDSEETKFEEDDYDFHRRDSVWVKPKGTSTWYQGVITKIKQPTDSEPLHLMKPGPSYLVVFRRYHTNLRAWFSPLEGNMKPDTPRVRALLQGSS
ncbi:hypothetical protein C8Q78DRAFT_1045211 [Trametes maxima]|nr:hypothetical protein C8Q78DRAFT_1045211 [Trametes maxima]